MKLSVCLGVAAVLLIGQILGSAASSKAHAAIDRIYDQMSEKANEAEQEGTMGTLSLKSEPIPTQKQVENQWKRLTELNLLFYILSFIREPMNFGLSCKLFWNVLAGFANYRIFEHRPVIDPTNFQLFLSPGGELSVPLAVRAFGNGALRVETEFLAKNLELAFCSPAFRAAFDSHIWSRVANAPAFHEITENILMESHDNPRLNSHWSSPELEAHRRTLIRILASLPEDSETVRKFFREYPVQLLKPSSTEICFHKFVIPIAKRLVLLPASLLINSVLPMFLYDPRLTEQIVNLFIQRAEHKQIREFMDATLPIEYQTDGLTYIGCVSVQSFVRSARAYLNQFDKEMHEILMFIESTAPAHMSDFVSSLLGRFSIEPLDLSEMFQVAILKSDRSALDSLENFDFSYEKDDSEFFSFLIARDPMVGASFLDRFPSLASHRAFLLNPQFQWRHFARLNNLRSARIELKRTIRCSEITRAHLHYMQDHQDRLFLLLLADSCDRISDYFTMKLRGHERKRYKEHPSFTIALMALDVFFESRLTRGFEGIDPEIVLKQMLSELNIQCDLISGEYFELAHGLPSFAKALLAGGLDEEDTLLVPEAASTQNLAEFDLLSRTISLFRVVHDGTCINYRLVLQWFQQFGFDLIRIIPQYELKALLKGAAFLTIRSVDGKKLRFDLDSLHQNDPFSMTYRYAVIIIVTQCRGIPAAAIKRIKSLFPGALTPTPTNDIVEIGVVEDNDELVIVPANIPGHVELLNLIDQACKFYRHHASSFFSTFKLISTNSRAERFLIDFIRHFIEISGDLQDKPARVAVMKFFEFIGLDSREEVLLRDHFVYFTLLASFRKEREIK